MAGRSFDGVNDNLLSANNAVAGINATQQSVAMWIQPENLGHLLNTMLADGAGNAVTQIATTTPTTSGYRLLFFRSWTGAGTWVSPDAPLSVPTHIAITYDRGSTANDPVLYINGASVAVTETATPSGTVAAGEDTLKFGETAGGAGDYSGLMAHIVIAAEVWTAAQVNRAMWWGRPGGGLPVYHPLLTSKLADEGSAAETLTATGAVMGALVTPCVRPGTAGLGMGVGW